MVSVPNRVAAGPGVEIQAQVALPTRYGFYETIGYVMDGESVTHVALVMGDVEGRASAKSCEAEDAQWSCWIPGCPA